MWLISLFILVHFDVVLGKLQKDLHHLSDCRNRNFCPLTERTLKVELLLAVRCSLKVHLRAPSIQKCLVSDHGLCNLYNFFPLDQNTPKYICLTQTICRKKPWTLHTRILYQSSLPQICKSSVHVTLSCTRLGFVTTLFLGLQHAF